MELEDVNGFEIVSVETGSGRLEQWPTKDWLEKIVNGLEIVPVKRSVKVESHLGIQSFKDLKIY